MKLNEEDYMGIVWGDNDAFELIKDDIIDTGRWDVQHEVVCKHIESGKFYTFCYQAPATEMQEVDHPSDLVLCEVRPVEKTVIVYERV